ncbi:hypothetical protein [Nocardia abscessus]|uniref:hypothetical protein n=1 Tax=Nocardia abscessus TaxID=120957 RepID=UPI002455B9C6|nr:hypothetical protein [Nocardia abscessus]
MFRSLSHVLRFGALVAGSSAVLAVASPVPAAAVPAGTIDLQSEWDVYQRPSGTQDSPLGFHVNIAQRYEIDDRTALAFTGFAHTSSMNGTLRDGQVRGTTITFTIDWDNNKTGVYHGNRFQDGYLRGHTARQNRPSENAEWWSGDNDWRVTG